MLAAYRGTLCYPVSNEGDLLRFERVQVHEVKLECSTNISPTCGLCKLRGQMLCQPQNSRTMFRAHGAQSSETTVHIMRRGHLPQDSMLLRQDREDGNISEMQDARKRCKDTKLRHKL